MRITIIGTGYVGLVAGTCFADTGHRVICADIDAEKINQLNKGVVPIYEPNLDHLIERNVKIKNLFFSTDLEESIKSAEVIFIAVGTPQDTDGSADLRFVLSVAETIGRNLDAYKVIVNKSTVPVGTGEKVKKKIATLTKTGFDVVSNPEFLKEGSAVDDFLKPDRIIIGADSEKARTVMHALYQPFIRNNHPILFMDVKSAEITKYASNAMLATRISFMNEIANYCDAIGADINMIRKGLGSDKRIGPHFLYSGIGYGGSCFPKDVKAFIRSFRENAMTSNILESVEEVNKRQKTILLEKMNKYYNDALDNRTFAVWGIAFKPETDDIREAPAIDIINALIKKNCKIKAYDPEATPHARKIFADTVEFYTNPYDCLLHADALILCTEWREFRNPDFDLIKNNLTEPVIFDGRNVFDTGLRRRGFTYFCIGSNLDPEK